MAYYNGKQGKWITTDTGRHVFIEEGKSIEEALADAFDEEYESDSDGPEFDPDDIPGDEVVPVLEFDDEPEEPKDTEPEEPVEIKDKEFKEKCLKSFRGIWDTPNSKIKQRFIQQFMNHPVVDEKLETILFDMLKAKTNIQRIWIKTEYTAGGSYYNSYSRKLIMNMSDGSDYGKTMETLFHEMGHGLDNNSKGGYHSSNYVSAKYGVTLADMLKTEFTENEDKISDLVNEYKRLLDVKNQLYSDYKDGKITAEKWRNERARIYSGAAISIVDAVQGAFGADYSIDKLGEYTHPKGYFDWKSDKYPDEAEKHNARNRGTEFFAEMTEDLAFDHEHLFSKAMEKIVPKSVEIYREILKEKYGYEK